jgi:tRNA A58 N-methylase Trm61
MKLPVIQVDLRAPFSHLFTVSGALEAGAGVRHSTSCSTAGERILEDLEDRKAVDLMRLRVAVMGIQR